jgi:hypothetical protein
MGSLQVVEEMPEGQLDLNAHGRHVLERIEAATKDATAIVVQKRDELVSAVSEGATALGNTWGAVRGVSSLGVGFSLLSAAGTLVYNKLFNSEDALRTVVRDKLRLEDSYISSQIMQLEESGHSDKDLLKKVDDWQKKHTLNQDSINGRLTEKYPALKFELGNLVLARREEVTEPLRRLLVADPYFSMDLNQKVSLILVDGEPFDMTSRQIISNKLEQNEKLTDSEEAFVQEMLSVLKRESEHKGDAIYGTSRLGRPAPDSLKKQVAFLSYLDRSDNQFKLNTKKLLSDDPSLAGILNPSNIEFSESEVQRLEEYGVKVDCGRERSGLALSVRFDWESPSFGSWLELQGNRTTDEPNISN